MDNKNDVYYWRKGGRFSIMSALISYLFCILFILGSDVEVLRIKAFIACFLFSVATFALIIYFLNKNNPYISIIGNRMLIVNSCHFCKSKMIFFDDIKEVKEINVRQLALHTHDGNIVSIGLGLLPHDNSESFKEYVYARVLIKGAAM